MAIAVAVSMSGCSPNDSFTPSQIELNQVRPYCLSGCQVALDDPNPDSVGVWMGDDFSAANCLGNAFNNDYDGDGMGDQCEWALAKRFAPILIFDDAADVDRKPYFAARPSGDSSVFIAYFPAYYVDLDCNSIPAVMTTG